MKNKPETTKRLRAFMKWPLLLSILLAVMTISIFLFDIQAGIVASGYFVVYVIVSIVICLYRRDGIYTDLIDYAANYGRVQKQLLKEMRLAHAILKTNGQLAWGNDEFLDIIKDEKEARKHISNVIPEIEDSIFPKNEWDTKLHVTMENGRSYRIVFRLVVPDKYKKPLDKSAETALEKLGGKENMIAMYMYDETEIVKYKRLNQDQKMVAGLLYIDNFEETLESVDEVRRSLLVALVERKINKYMASIDAIVKKMEKDKYVFVFQYKYLKQLEESKFSILEEVRTVNIGNELPVTISIGIGANSDAYLLCYEQARAAIDLALGRGGDQAVVKGKDGIAYYGGKSVQVEKTTRVKARVKAHALKELVEAKEKVVIMGHSMGDVDSFGAAIGVYRIAKTLDKRAHIVINEVTSSVRPIMERFVNNSDYEEDMIINSEQAMQIVNRDTLLVIVDVNRPSYTECEELIHKTRTVVILDHHRRTGEEIRNAVLSYIEPYASSACEMVAEILQYIGDGLKIKQAEADAMYSGIMIDTNNFLNKTGVRTFEAAAYLRRNGADVTRIRKGFRSDMNEYKIRAEAIQHTEVYLECYAITECSGEGCESPTILGAQVANELLDISGVKASFVLTKYNEKIYISARSIDELNVQVVMEKLGGGGHMSVAGAQLTDCTMEEAKQKVREVLDGMNQEGEL